MKQAKAFNSAASMIPKMKGLIYFDIVEMLLGLLTSYQISL